MTRKAFDTAVEELIGLLIAYGPGDDRVANPWVDSVPGFDLPDAAARRVENLRRYLRAHREAGWMLVGQEAGYAGCRFSGIPFTGEDQLEGSRALPVFAGKGYRRSSVLPKPSSERSANIVWPCIGTSGRAVLWNSFPFHCHEPGKPLTNRAWCTRDDRDGLGERILRHIVERTFPGAKLIAVGRKAEASLAALGYEATGVRHPSQGGATIFRGQMAELLGAPTGGDKGRATPETRRSPRRSGARAC